MAITTIPWGDGSGDNIYLSAPSQTGDQFVSVTSDPNTGAARSKVVTFSAVGVTPVSLTINQAAGGGGGNISNYVQDGLVLLLDGIDKGNVSGAWTDLIGGKSFTNHGATFNDDNVQFDGTDDYLDITAFSVPTPICIAFAFRCRMPSPASTSRYSNRQRVVALCSFGHPVDILYGLIPVEIVQDRNRQ